MSKHVDPTKDQFAEFASLPDDGPIWMLNMIRLRKKARYADGREASGAEAYGEYSKAVAPLLAGVGGKIVTAGSPQAVLIGPDDERWDLIFIAEYPSAAAFLQMVSDPAYQAIVFHRQAAVKTSRLIRMKPGSPASLGK